MDGSLLLLLAFLFAIIFTASLQIYEWRKVKGIVGQIMRELAPHPKDD